MTTKYLAHVELEDHASGLRSDDEISEICFSLSEYLGNETANIEITKYQHPDRPFGVKDLDPNIMDDLCIQWLRARDLIVED